MAQSLIGSPVNQDERDGLGGRVCESLTKALREAKQNSGWLAPPEEYEQAVSEFAALNGLSQLLLKITVPGVPDFYQGTEFWQFSLVDPDNRRPVDYHRRIALLENLRKREAEDRIGLIRELAADPLRDEVKMWVTWKALEFRRNRRELFARGGYIPLRAEGPGAPYVCAFARRDGKQWAVTVAPRWTARLADWGDTRLVLPLEAPAEWRDAVSGLERSHWLIGDLMEPLPVALLGSGS